jgi:hypothetical protein
VTDPKNASRYREHWQIFRVCWTIGYLLYAPVTTRCFRQGTRMTCANSFTRADFSVAVHLPSYSTSKCEQFYSRMATIGLRSKKGKTGLVERPSAQTFCLVSALVGSPPFTLATAHDVLNMLAKYNRTAYSIALRPCCLVHLSQLSSQSPLHRMLRSPAHAYP